MTAYQKRMINAIIQKMNEPEYFGEVDFSTGWFHSLRNTVEGYNPIEFGFIPQIMKQMGLVQLMDSNVPTRFEFTEKGREFVTVELWEEERELRLKKLRVDYRNARLANEFYWLTTISAFVGAATGIIALIRTFMGN